MQSWTARRRAWSNPTATTTKRACTSSSSCSASMRSPRRTHWWLRSTHSTPACRSCCARRGAALLTWPPRTWRCFAACRPVRATGDRCCAAFPSRTSRVPSARRAGSSRRRRTDSTRWSSGRCSEPSATRSRRQRRSMRSRRCGGLSSNSGAGPGCGRSSSEGGASMSWGSTSGRRPRRGMTAVSRAAAAAALAATAAAAAATPLTGARRSSG
mmetsp:Transcript_37412/g.114862  ORF Transcript_37412/g.114862 Transcript_37412/m.114862 type:complete len:213 (-) Transcript_37412:161-799(-)